MSLTPETKKNARYIAVLMSRNTPASFAIATKILPKGNFLTSTSSHVVHTGIQCKHSPRMFFPTISDTFLALFPAIGNSGDRPQKLVGISDGPSENNRNDLVMDRFN